MRAAVQELAPAFEKSTGHRLVFEYATVAKIEERVTHDEPIDVAILTKPVFDRLASAGKMIDGTTQLAHVPIGFAVKHGLPKPDIGSVEAFTHQSAS
jgi:molybdate transport system substrate-binding protein